MPYVEGVLKEQPDSIRYTSINLTGYNEGFYSVYCEYGTCQQSQQAAFTLIIVFDLDEVFRPVALSCYKWPFFF